ncbi:hypothetical protein [Flammeovirga sp. EKP202]|uniref:hypothetical protein n=1 Tax=Flammeovirga sp. EKP202 TaxID=2770592 RepID=UPI00165FD0BA|nr:hypothetical protein [Flammeovirga sp. EKP202]MBD0404558.1 hypothetical protein [Flammeovirga sp. EKP202]
MVELSKKDKYLSLTIADLLINDQGIQSEDEVEKLPKEHIVSMLDKLQEGNASKVVITDTYLHTFRAILKFDVAYLLRSNRCCS